MARPQKAVVDYFPHYVKRGKTILALESRFGNDGYAFWFKLLEILGETENHYFDCNNPANMEYLLAITKVSEETASNILDLLARVDAIDRDLWQEKIIWSQNFVDGVKDAYKRRKIGIPQKPSLCKQKPASEGINVSINDTSTPEYANINPQSKVNKSKYINYYLNNINPAASPLEIKKLCDWENDLPEDMICLAIEKAVEQNQRRLSYIDGILRNWLKENLITIEAVRLNEEQRKGGRNGRTSRNSQSNNRKGQDELDRIDFSKFEFKG